MASIVPLYELRVGSRTYLVPLSNLQNSTQENNSGGGGKSKKKKQKTAQHEEAPLVYIQQQPAPVAASGPPPGVIPPPSAPVAHHQVIQAHPAVSAHAPVTIQTLHPHEVNNEISIIQEPYPVTAVSTAGGETIHLTAAPPPAVVSAAPAVPEPGASGVGGAGEVPGATKYPLVKARCPYCPRIFDYGAKLKKHALEAHGKDSSDMKIQRATREVKHSCQLCGHSVVRFYQHICRHLSARHRNECGISKYLERFYRHIEMEDTAMGGSVVAQAVAASAAAAANAGNTRSIIVTNGGLTTTVGAEPELIVPEMMHNAVSVTTAVTAANCMQLSDDPVLSNATISAGGGDDTDRIVSNAMSAEPVVISEASAIEISTEAAEAAAAAAGVAGVATEVRVE